MILAAGLARQGGGQVWLPYTGIFNSADAAAGMTISASGSSVATGTNAGVYRSCRSTVVLTGKCFWHIALDPKPNTDAILGVMNSSSGLGDFVGENVNGWGYRSDGTKNNNGATAHGDTFTSGDILTVAVDVAAASIWFAKNFVWQASGNPITGANPAFTNLSGSLSPAVSGITVSVSGTYFMTANAMGLS